MTARHLAKLCEETTSMRHHRAFQIGNAGAESTAKALGALQRGESRYPDAPLMAALFEAVGLEVAAWFRDPEELHRRRAASDVALSGAERFVTRALLDAQRVVPADCHPGDSRRRGDRGS